MDSRLYFPATQRNREPILNVLRLVLPTHGTVVEVACGSGEHAAYFAAALPTLTWLPTDAEPEHVASASAWAEGVPNLLPAQRLRLTVDPWPEVSAAAIFCANMVHISPWEVTLALLAVAEDQLSTGAPLVLYGPYRIGGRHTSDSNQAFDASLRARDPSWGVRDLEDVLAAAPFFRLEQRFEMPANNQILWLKRI